VLVVDDVETNLDVAKGILRPYGMRVDCVRSGSEAVRRVRAGKIKYDAILMDQMMPEMNGIEAARIIREEIDGEYAKTVPIIALTANVIDSAETLSRCGFQDFIAKPIDICKMDSVINRWVRNLTCAQVEEKEGARTLESAKSVVSRAVEPEDESFRIEGIDWKKGLARFENDAGTFKEFLRSYQKHTARDLRRIREPEKENLLNYAIIVHGIRGSSREIEATEVARMALPLELASKAGNLEFVRRNNPAFIVCVETLLANIATALPIDAPEVKKEFRRAPDEPLLEELLDAAKNFKIDAMERIVSTLDRFEYESGGALVERLVEYVQEMKFSEVCDALIQRRGLSKNGEIQ
jgi:CheY-like chemotaxis protein